MGELWHIFDFLGNNGSTMENNGFLISAITVVEFIMSYKTICFVLFIGGISTSNSVLFRHRCKAVAE